jgi:phosphoribosylaminoimidazolecarboxamide formyltransferase/IMP cyclohydrolase
LKKYALISVSDKTDVINLASGLVSANYDILATGNTAKYLKENKIDCIEVSDFTGFPEIFDGRVKTLQPKIFGGILMRRDNPSDIKEAEENDIPLIDVVCVNLYPFPKVYKDKNLSLDTKIENIDIGGPSLIRAASKNYKYISVLTDPSQYDDFLTRLKNNSMNIEFRQFLAGAAFSYTSFYDTLIANFFENSFSLPQTSVRVNYKLDKPLRYGENPHQAAFLAGNFEDFFDVFYGKEISYNNIVDLVAAVELVQDLGDNACAIIKHTNPCGAAIGADAYDAYTKALTTDSVSAYGGIVAFTNIVDEKTAEKLNEIFLEIVCAPGFTEEAQKILFQKKNRRLVKVLKSLGDIKYQMRSIPGGILMQERDTVKLTKESLQVVSKKKPEDSELDDMLFAAILAKHVKSNAIVFVKNRVALGVGAGQMSRVD